MVEEGDSGGVPGLFSTAAEAAAPRLDPSTPDPSNGNRSAADRRRHDPRRIPFREIPLFRNVEAAQLEEALSDCEVLRLPAGTVLLRPGQANDVIYVVVAGTMVVHLDDQEHPERGIPIPLGQCIGEFSAIDGQPVSALVQADTVVEVLRIPQSIFWWKLVGLPGVARNMMRGLTERTRLTNRLALEAQRERLELQQLRKELDLARELQSSMLPLQRPLFPERHEIEVSALMEPASTVGGDFFDAFFVDEGTLFFCIGDVSGHGIGASLLMARTIGLLRILAITTKRPDKLLATLNDRLAEGNDTCVFVTLFCAFLDVASGRLTYSNGGHCAPLIVRGEGVEPLPLPAGVLIGAFPARTYRSLQGELAPGEALFLYTDGITEAEDPAGQAFAVEGCVRVLHQERQAAPQEVLDRLRLEVKSFTGRESLDDDGTLLLLRRPRATPA